VAAVLGDALRRVSVLGGREGMPRSLGSVLAGSVTRFLGGVMRSASKSVIKCRGIVSSCNGVAVSRDGSTLLVSDNQASRLVEFDIATGDKLRAVGDHGNGKMQFASPRQVFIADDGTVFVADSGNGRVQVLTPALTFHSTIGVGVLGTPKGVVATAEDVVVADSQHGDVRVFCRADGTPTRVLCPPHELREPLSLCLVPYDRRVAVVNCTGHSVTLLRLDGPDERGSNVVRHFGGGELRNPLGIAFSAHSEFVVAQRGRLSVFSDDGALLEVLVNDCDFSGVWLHGSRVFVQSRDDKCCFVFN
jgi:DNA-binding beta-propeller fold protein YncE